MKPSLALRVVPLLVAPFIVHCSDADPEPDESLGEVSQALCTLSALSSIGASASSVEQPAFPAANAIDGNASTRWSSAFNDPQWLEVDLGAERWVSRLRLNWETAASANYDIQVRSTTTASWTTIYTDTTGNGGIDDITGLGAMARYVRVYSRARTTGYGNSLWEFEVFGDANPNCNASGIVIPARIEAEGYSAYFDMTAGDSGNGCPPSDNVDTELTADPNGGTCDVGWTVAGEWLEYTLVANTAQIVDFTARVASLSTGKTVRLELDGVSIGSLTAPSSGWQSFADRTISGVNVSAGSHVLRVVFETGQVNLNYINVTPAAAAALLVPARVEAETASSFSDTTSANLGGACSSNAVDKELTSDTGGGCNVGWTEPGEWLQYNLRTDSAQTLNFTARVASALTGKSIHLELDNVNIGSLSAPSAGWQGWADKTIRNIAVGGGNHTLRVVFDNGGVNLNWIDVNAQPLQSVSLNPTADATVASATPTTKLGALDTLESSTSTNGSIGSRWSYFKFNVGQFTDISSAKLSLRGHQDPSSGADAGATLYAVSSTSWNESTVDWNTKPAVGSALATSSIHAGGDDYYRFDVSSYVRSEKAAGRSVVSFALKNSGQSDTKLVFNAREQNYNGINMVPPELVITTKDAPLKAPSHDAVDSFVTTPAAQALYEIPVVVIRYLPTRDAANLSPVDMGRAWIGSDPPLDQATARVDRMDKQLKFGVEEGSRFHGYANAAAKPSLGYRIVDVVTVYEELPDGPDYGSGQLWPDYAAVLNRFNLRDYVENRGVKQFWIWSGNMGRRTLNESRMVNKFGPDWDADNGNRDPAFNLPRLSKTYFTFHYAWMGPLANALHNHGHQYEAAYGYTSLWRHGTPDRFFVDYCGVNPVAGRFEPGRAGDVHHPFNANHTPEYDYTNMTSVWTDIEDWKPQGGTQKFMNASRFMNMPYAWPDGVAPAPAGSYDLAHAQWQIYWAQNFPGRGNRVQNAAGQYMTNWFRFLGDWDTSFGNSLGLFGSTPDPN